MIGSYDIIKDVEDFIKEATIFISEDKYISVKEYTDFFNKYNDVLVKINEHKDIITESLYEQVNSIYNKRVEILKKHNSYFLNRKLIEYKDYFDNMFEKIDANILLDDNQRKAILADEDNLLIVAGAGSGKTTTMAAKVKYLIEKCHVKQSEIAVISFTNKATEEIGKRINIDFGFDLVNVMTFHKLGLKIIRASNRDIDNIVGESGQYKIISNYIKNILFKDKDGIQELNNAFKSKLNFKDEFSNFTDFFEYHEKQYNDILKNVDLPDYIEKVKKARRKYKRSLDGNYFRSKEEVDIANFLYTNGIDYEYEKAYDKKVGDNQSYHPDFYIYQGELDNYIEHFGISEDLKTSGLNIKEHDYYVKNYYMKNKFHNEPDNYNKFIHTFSKYNRGTNYLKELEKALLEKGYVFIMRTDEEIFENMKKTSEDVYFSSFIDRVVIPFIKVFKSKNYHLEDFKMLDEKAKKLDISSQVSVLEKIYIHYQSELSKSHLIDFEDMINLAYEIMPKIKESDVHVDYNYIIIDEYQDISMQRYNLMKRISDLFGAKIMAVGDDFQAIFGFSGASIDLFTDFKKYLDNAKMIPILNTYRNSQELIDIAGEFVQKNNNQIKKRLKSIKHLDNPVLVYMYDDNRKTDNLFKAQIVSTIIEDIYRENNKSRILIMGRYKNDINDLIITNLFASENDKIISKIVPNADIDYLTIHSAKGLGYDNCILLNLSNDKHGFPSRIEDEPIIKLIKPSYDEGIDYPEERRLFYVALTRTKNKIYLLTPKNHISSFINEIKDYDNVKIIDNSSINNITGYACKNCGTYLNSEKYEDTDYLLFKCYNCGLITTMPMVQEKVDICPKCQSIVVYKYKNNNCKVYACINKKCDYKLYKFI